MLGSGEGRQRTQTQPCNKAEEKKAFFASFQGEGDGGEGLGAAGDADTDAQEALAQGEVLVFTEAFGKGGVVRCMRALRHNDSALWWAAQRAGQDGSCPAAWRA